MAPPLNEIGSFRDRHGQVFYRDDRVFRGLSAEALGNWKRLESTEFFKRFSGEGRIIGTRLLDSTDLPEADSWSGILEHDRIPFVSYPYEWSFRMLKEAAQLQLELVLAALNEGMILKDASSFNIQWTGAKPVFIDIPSFEAWTEGEPWVGYRQFCQLFLYPLMLQSYKGIGFQALLRGRIDGIDPEECSRMMSLRDRIRPGVLSHVYLQAKLEARCSASQSNARKEIRTAGFSRDLIRNNLQGLLKTVKRLTWKQTESTWSEYTDQHSYSADDEASKEEFVSGALEKSRPGLVWDCGCNTGSYSRIASKHAEYVIALDSDHLAVERLFNNLQRDPVPNILPLVSNLADPSPNLGWRGLERRDLASRGSPDFVLCLALIHHIVITANVPVSQFIDWLFELGADLIIEFVTKEDPMVRRLLANKDDQYSDYELDYFEDALAEKFRIDERLALTSGARYLYLARPRK
jgi:SAM-dependent methyltransferase